MLYSVHEKKKNHGNLQNFFLSFDIEFRGILSNFARNTEDTEVEKSSGVGFTLTARNINKFLF
jgi:hypothetical protein